MFSGWQFRCFSFTVLCSLWIESCLMACDVFSFLYPVLIYREPFVEMFRSFVCGICNTDNSIRLPPADTNILWHGIHFVCMHVHWIFPPFYKSLQASPNIVSVVTRLTPVFNGNAFRLCGFQADIWLNLVFNKIILYFLNTVQLSFGKPDCRAFRKVLGQT